MLNPTIARIRYDEQKNEFLSYKDFGASAERTIKAFKDFYSLLFPAVFFWYYPYRTESMILGATRHVNRIRESGDIKKERLITNCSRSCTRTCFCDFLNTPFCIKSIKPITTDDECKDNGGILFFPSRRCWFTSDKYCERLSLDSTEQYFFSVSVFYLVLIPQVITKVLGENGKTLFLHASGCPEVSSGLGGCVSAEQWLYESGDLFPSIEEATYYNTLLDITFSFFREELQTFLQGNDANTNSDAYKQLKDLAKDKISNVMEMLYIAVQQAEVNFSTGQHPIYYL